MYIHHLIFKMDNNVGDWFDLVSKLTRELRWMRIKRTGSPKIWPPNDQVPRYGPPLEEFVKANQESMPIHNLLLRALEEVKLDILTWKTLYDDVNQVCPTKIKGAKRNEGGPVRVSSSELFGVLEAFFRLQPMDQDRQALWTKVVNVVQEIRKKESANSGWSFSGYPH
jgi:hypothetical protein